MADKTPEEPTVPTSSGSKPNQTKASKYAKAGCIGCLGLIAGVVFLIFVLGFIGFLVGPSARHSPSTAVPSRSDEEKANAEAEKKCSDTITAFVASQTFVERRLRAPATAKFPYMGDSQVNVKYLGNCTHEVSAFVDAQNTFGALIRTSYYVKLRNNVRTGDWEALEIRVGP